MAVMSHFNDDKYRLWRNENYIDRDVFIRSVSASDNVTF